MTLRLGDHREVLADVTGAHLAMVDPPYGDTSLGWDQLATDWLDTVGACLAPNGSVWLWGSLRSLTKMIPAAEAHGWTVSQDVVWEKHNGSGFAADRFKRVHEHAVLLYRGPWSDVHHEPQRVVGGSGNKSIRWRNVNPAHAGQIGNTGYEDDGTRLVRSVFMEAAPRDGLHPTQKPIGMTRTLVRYSCPPGGLVVVPYGGSGTDLLAAEMTGRRAIGAELDPGYHAAALARLAEPRQGDLLEGVSP